MTTVTPPNNAAGDTSVTQRKTATNRLVALTQAPWVAARELSVRRAQIRAASEKREAELRRGPSDMPDSYSVPLLPSLKWVRDEDGHRRIATADEHAFAAAARPQTHWDHTCDVAVGFPSFLIGLVIGTLLVMSINVADFWNVSCPSVNGRVCNGRGVCPPDSSGYCVCDVLFSGSACTDTAVPAYSPESNTFCGGNGIAAPMTLAMVPAECRWTTPSVQNGFADPGPGWAHPGCIQELQKRRATMASAGYFLTAEAATAAGLSGLPRCLCSGQAVGDTCSYSACPRSAEGLVCGGNGNASVSLFRNGSDVTNGDGCYATNVFTVWDTGVRGRLSVETLRVMSSPEYVQFFSQPFAGRAVVTADGGLIFLKAPLLPGQSTVGDIACACRAGMKGDTCLDGECPMSNGLPCAGHGDPRFGNGAEVNTTRTQFDGRPCSVRCSEAVNAEACPSGGALSVVERCGPASNALVHSSSWCRVAETCPVSAPWRCPDGRCVTGANARCDLGYEWATLDPPRIARKPCNMSSFDVASSARCLPALTRDASSSPGVWFDDITSTTVASTFSVNFSRPLAWFYFSARAAAATTAVVDDDNDGGGAATATTTVTVTYAGQTFTLDVSASTTATAARLLVTPAVPETLLADANFADVVGNDGGTAYASLTLRLYGDADTGRVQFWGDFPFFDTLPATFSQNNVRLVNRLDGTLVELIVDAGALSFELAPWPFTDDVVVTRAALFASSSTMLRTDGTAMDVANCLARPRLCTWNVLRNDTDGSMALFSLSETNANANATTQQLRRWAYPVVVAGNASGATTNATTWTSSAPVTDVDATPYYFRASSLPTGVVEMRTVVSARNRVKITTPNAFFVGAWRAQFRTPPHFGLTFVASPTPVLIDDLEWGTMDLIQRPCVCEPQSFTGRFAPNRTDQDMLWGNDAKRVKLLYEPGEAAVAPFVFAGAPYYRRGLVVAGDAHTTRVAVRGFGVLALPTSDLRAITTRESTTGRDDVDLNAYSSRCPTGYATNLAVSDTTIHETCRCDVSADNDDARATCHCDGDDDDLPLTCTCDLSMDSQRPPSPCDCDVADRNFEAELAATLQRLHDGCACHSSASSSFSSVNNNVVVENGTLTLTPAMVDAQVTLLGIFSPPSILPCPNITAIWQLDARFDGNATTSTNRRAVRFVTSCSSDVGYELVVLPDDNDVDRGTAYVLEFRDENGELVAPPPTTTTTMTAWLNTQGEGEPATGLTYSASASLPGHAPELAARFDGTWWAAPQPPWGNTAWLAVAMDPPSPVTRVMVHVRAAALPAVGTTPALPVVLRLEGRRVDNDDDDNDDDWQLLANWTSSLSVDHRMIPLSGNGGVWRELRVVSDFALQISWLTPFVDQHCVCANATTANDDVAVTLVDPTRFPRTNALLTSLALRDAALGGGENENDDSTSTCVCENACVVRGGVDVTRNGVCNDLPGAMFVTNTTAAVETVVTETRRSPRDVWMTVFGELVEFAAATANGNGTLYGNITFPITTQPPSASVMVSVFHPPSPSPLSAYAAGFWWVTTASSVLPAPTMSDAVIALTRFLASNGTYDFANYANASVFVALNATNGNQPVFGHNITLDVAGDWALVTTTTRDTVTFSRMDFSPDSTCASGMDCADCGPRRVARASSSTTSRTPPVGLPTAPGATCTLSTAERLIADALRNNSSEKDPGELRPLAGLGLAWRAFGLALTRRDLRPVSACPGGQVCPFDAPIRCLDGSCAKTTRACVETNTRYDCWGDGCVLSSVSEQDYRCECAPRWDGRDCTAGATSPAKPYAYGENPWTQTTCQGPGSLTEELPADSAVPILPIDAAEVLRRNRKWHPRRVPVLNEAVLAATNVVHYDLVDMSVGRDLRPQPDVRDYSVQSRHRCGQRLLRTVQLPTDPPGQTIRTRCPFAHAGPFGQLVTLRDDAMVYSTTPPFRVLQWRCWPKPGGLSPDDCVTYPWHNETHYDEFPFPGANGRCYRNRAEAAVDEKLRPTCNGNGACRADGSCDCNPGFTTFFVTKQLTAAVTAGDSCDFGTPALTTWRDFNRVCAARDCSVVDCSPPMGCFPGTPELNFADRWVMCPSPTRTRALNPAFTSPDHAGKCARTLQDCDLGNVEPALPCSGNGVLYQEDWRPGVWACHCGAPRSRTANIADITDTSQLIPNGFAGRACREYYCEDTRFSWHYFDEQTGMPFSDLGVDLPGRFIGACGATIGPDPADVASGKWAACDCPRGQRWDSCRTVPCLKAGQLSCMDPSACFAGGGQPLVYPCNNNGRPLADGTCDCKQDATEGVFYSSDITRFSLPNCFAQRACETSALNGMVCHQRPSCSAPDAWIRCPADPFFNGQIDAQMLVQGEAPSNTSFVRQVTTVDSRNSFRLQSLLALVTSTKQALSGIQNCICVSAGEDPAAPLGMRPYDTPPSLLAAVGPYAKGYTYPYEVPIAGVYFSGTRYTTAQATAVLTDTRWYTRTSDDSVDGGDYVKLRNAGETFFVEFANARAFRLHAVRIHARFFPPISFATPPRFEFLSASSYFSSSSSSGGGNGSTTTAAMCTAFSPSTPELTSPVWRWYTALCSPIYRAFDVQASNPSGFLANCVPDASTDICTDWRRRECEASEGVYVEPGSPTILRGCTVARSLANAGDDWRAPPPKPFVGCCKQTTFVSQEPDAGMILRVVSTGDVHVDELRLLGYAAEADDVPDAMQREMVSRMGSSSAACARRPDVKLAAMALGLDQDYYSPGECAANAISPTCASGNVFNTTQYARTFSSAVQLCRATGGWLASQRGGVVAPSLGNSPVFVEAMGRIPLAQRSGNSNPRRWVSLQDRSAAPVLKINDHVLPSCRAWGCRWKNINGANSGTSLGYTATHVFSAGILNGGATKYETPWASAVSSVAGQTFPYEHAKWADLLTRFAGPPPSASPSIKSNGNEVHCEVQFFARKNCDASPPDACCWCPSLTPPAPGVVCAPVVGPANPTPENYCHLFHGIPSHTYDWNDCHNGYKTDVISISTSGYTGPNNAAIKLDISLLGKNLFSVLGDMITWHDVSSSSSRYDLPFYQIRPSSVVFRGTNCALSVCESSTPGDTTRACAPPLSGAATPNRPWDVYISETGAGASGYVVFPAYQTVYTGGGTPSNPLPVRRVADLTVTRTLSPNYDYANTAGCVNLKPPRGSKQGGVREPDGSYEKFTSIRFIPTVTVAKAIIAADAPMVDQRYADDPTRSHVMGWLTQPYSCMALNMQILEYVTPAPGYVPNTDDLGGNGGGVKMGNADVHVSGALSTFTDADSPYVWQNTIPTGLGAAAADKITPTTTPGTPTPAPTPSPFSSMYTMTPAPIPSCTTPTSLFNLPGCSCARVGFIVYSCTRYTLVADPVPELGHYTLLRRRDPTVTRDLPGEIDLYQYTLARCDGTDGIITNPRQIHDCDRCELHVNTQWFWDAHAHTDASFPDGQADIQNSGLPAVTHARLLNLRHGASPNAYLDALGDDLSRFLYYVHENAALTPEGFRANGGSQWTIERCATLDVAGSWRPADCLEDVAGALCMYDYTGKIALPGRTCDACGINLREGGAAKPGQRCTDGFPMADPAKNPGGFAALAAYEAGTLDLLVQTDVGDMDGAAAFLQDADVCAWWALPDAYDKWAAGFSNQPGAVSPRGVTEDREAWVNYAISKLYPVTCGPRVDVTTGLVLPYCAAEPSYCDPGAPQRPTTFFEPSELPTGLGPLSDGIDARFEPACGLVLRPAVYLVADDDGLPQPDYELSFVVLPSSSKYLTLGVLGTARLSLYNTQKDASSYVFAADKPPVDVSGVVSLICPSCPSAQATVTVWVSPMNPDGLYPSPGRRLVLGSFTVTSDAGDTRYSFPVTITTAQAADATYRSIGWDVDGLVHGATISFGNVILSTQETRDACRAGVRVRMPKPKPRSAVVSGAPNHVCVANQADEIYYGVNQAQCACDVDSAGSRCDCPAIATRFGKLCLGGWGTGFGRAVGWDGTTRPVAGDAPHGESGVFISTPPGRTEPLAAGACRDVGRDMWTRLTRTRDAPIVYVYTNMYGGAKYVAVDLSNPQTATSGQSLSFFETAAIDAASAGGTMASYVSEDELHAYLDLLATMKAANVLPTCSTPLAATGATTCPENFLDLARNDLTNDGNADLSWRARAFPFYPTAACQSGTTGCVDGALMHCTSADDCGDRLPSFPVTATLRGLVCSPTPTPTPTAAPAAACAAINFNNHMYQNALSTCGGSMSLASSCSDGSWTPVPIPSAQTVTLSLAMDSVVYVWYLSSPIGSYLAPVPSSECLAQPLSPTVPFLFTYVCSAAPSITLTLPAAGALFEIQAFAQQDYRRTRFYPYR